MRNIKRNDPNIKKVRVLIFKILEVYLYLKINLESLIVFFFFSLTNDLSFSTMEFLDSAEV